MLGDFLQALLGPIQQERYSRDMVNVLTGWSFINNFKCVTGFRLSVLKIAGWDVE